VNEFDTKQQQHQQKLDPELDPEGYCFASNGIASARSATSIGDVDDVDWDEWNDGGEGGGEGGEDGEEDFFEDYQDQQQPVQQKEQQDTPQTHPTDPMHPKNHETFPPPQTSGSVSVSPREFAMDMSIYVFSGLFLIFAMEQFIQIGTHL
jgi:hypothetical protein